jgi:hypothetical protein
MGYARSADAIQQAFPENMIFSSIDDLEGIKYVGPQSKDVILELFENKSVAELVENKSEIQKYKRRAKSMLTQSGELQGGAKLHIAPIFFKSPAKSTSPVRGSPMRVSPVRSRSPLAKRTILDGASFSKKRYSGRSPSLAGPPVSGTRRAEMPSSCSLSPWDEERCSVDHTCTVNYPSKHSGKKKSPRKADSNW